MARLRLGRLRFGLLFGWGAVHALGRLLLVHHNVLTKVHAVHHYLDVVF